jgi:hydroxymethylpyrimidine/phosphomethylpyrimidine kinase
VSAVLVIGGTDSSGGAGLARDLETLAHFGVRAVCAVTAVTAQSDSAVNAVHIVPAEMVRAQIAAAFATCAARAIKVGMLATAASVAAVADSVPPRSDVPLVVDPVLAASSGGVLLDAAGQTALRELLLARATILTPNIPEVAALLERRPAEDEAELVRQGHALLALGAEAVLLKGGHGTGPEAIDLLLRPGQAPWRLSAPRLPSTRRGTGCALASAIAAALAAGLDVNEACARAKQHVTQLLQQDVSARAPGTT